jgi:hypothetical protein
MRKREISGYSSLSPTNSQSSRRQEEACSACRLDELSGEAPIHSRRKQQRDEQYIKCRIDEKEEIHTKVLDSTMLRFKRSLIR